MITVTSRILTGLIVAATLAALGLLVVVPRLTHGTWLTVLTGSMSPTIPAGSLVLVKPLDPETIKAGDVITWQVRPGEATYVTHRVVRVEDGTTSLSFVTKGDANRGEDTDPVSAGAVRGKVMFDVPHLGSVRNRVGGGFGIGMLVAAAGLALLLPQAGRIVKGRRGPDDGTPDALLTIDDDGVTGTEPSPAAATPTTIERELVQSGGRQGKAGPPLASLLLLALVVVTGAAAGRGLTTVAPFTDHATVNAQAGATTWAPEAPPECAGMTFTNVIEGTSAGEVLNGTNKADLIFGYGGNDTLSGGNQNDCLVGGLGDDTLYGDNGEDVLIGGTGQDLLDGGNAKDKLYGGDGDDTLLGANGSDFLDGGAGTNTCTGGSAPDIENCENPDATP